jgi:fucose 4-O-acetylase-like acetyltransferase
MASSTPNHARNDFLDYLKGVLIFLVVWGHLIQLPRAGGDLRFYDDPIFKAIYTFHMPLFMAVSGFVSFHSIFSSPFFYCVQKRFRQVIVPAICWPVLYLVCLLVIFIAHRESVAGGWLQFKNSLPGFRPGLWFLWAVFGSTVVVAALRKFKLDRLEIFVAATVVFLFLPDGGDIIYLFKYTFLFFGIGYALAKGDQIRVPQRIHPVVIVAIFVVSGICYAMWGYDTYVYTTRMRPVPGNLHNIAFRLFAGMIISAAFTILIQVIYRLAKSKMLSKWGRYSLGIYVIHCTIIVGLNVLRLPSVDSIWYSSLGAPALAALVCFITCLMAEIISRVPLAGTLLLGQARKR